MSLVINHNLMAANTARNLNAHYSKLGQSVQRLSTGLRVNSAADDAAGLAIRELQRADIATLQQGARNANDAVSLIQTADGALGVIDEKLIRMKELAEQAATGTYDSTQRLVIESEYQAMASEITRIANATDFNGIHLLNGNLSGEHNGSGLTSTGALKVHFGTGNDSAEDYYYIQVGCATASALGVGNTAVMSPPELTSAYYENLRNAAGTAAYTATYAEKYQDFYISIYDKLTAGTPPDPGIDAQDASAQAATQAQVLAETYAKQDEKMSMAALDKIYDDNYSTPYLNAYTSYISQGMSPVQADSKAMEAAQKAAFAAVQEANQTVATDGNISSLTTPPPGVLPPRNSEGAEAFIEHIGSIAKESVYNNVYSSLYNDAVTKAKTALVIVSPAVLSPEQVLEIHSACDTTAQSMANTLGAQVQSAMNSLYRGTYDGDGITSGFNYYYNEALVAGNPTRVAQNIAENMASADAWTNMTSSLGSVFGLTPAGAAWGHQLDQSQLNASNTFSVSGITITATKTGIPSDITSIYTDIGTNGTTYLDTDHGLVGGEGSMVAASSTFAQEHTFNLTRPRPGATISTQEAAQQALAALTQAIVSKDNIRANLGAIQNRLENTITNLNIQAENLQAAESRISDVDVATEMTEFVRQQILAQSAVAMLAQANSLPQMAMQLIGG